jgi:hypothetical protein
MKLWLRNPRYKWHCLWEPLWDLWVENACYDEEEGYLEIHRSSFNPLTKWQVRLLSIVFNYDYWYYEEVENCPWLNELERHGVPYHSRF